MNPEVSGYYRSSSPWGCLDNKLTPIFNHIRNKNIRNYFQLGEERRKAESAFAVP
jgi:hypothetical protein